MLIRALDLAEKYNNRLIYLGTVSLLARIMNEFEQYSEAYRILSSVMPYVVLFKRWSDLRSLSQGIVTWKQLLT
jgi:hypothetical protein